MAEKSATVRKALAMMKKRKLEQAGVPKSQMAAQMAGVDESGTDTFSSGRAALEQQNNALAQQLLKKQQDEIKKKAKQGK